MELSGAVYCTRRFHSFSTRGQRRRTLGTHLVTDRWRIRTLQPHPSTSVSAYSGSFRTRDFNLYSVLNLRRL